MPCGGESEARAAVATDAVRRRERGAGGNGVLVPRGRRWRPPTGRARRWLRWPEEVGKPQRREGIRPARLFEFQALKVYLEFDCKSLKIEIGCLQRVHLLLDRQAHPRCSIDDLVS
ncbi:hypothetical protein ACP70R_001534 [Stipagrostis hirtigluma subsp. patula]